MVDHETRLLSQKLGLVPEEIALFPEREREAALIWADEYEQMNREPDRPLPIWLDAWRSIRRTQKGRWYRHLWMLQYIEARRLYQQAMDSDIVKKRYAGEIHSFRISASGHNSICSSISLKNLRSKRPSFSADRVSGIHIPRSRRGEWTRETLRHGSEGEPIPFRFNGSPISDQEFKAIRFLRDIGGAIAWVHLDIYAPGISKNWIKQHPMLGWHVYHRSGRLHLKRPAHPEPLVLVSSTERYGTMNGPRDRIVYGIEIGALRPGFSPEAQTESGAQAQPQKQQEAFPGH